MSIGAPLRKRSSRVPVDLHAIEHRVFLQALRQAGLPAPTPEYRFAAPRRWRFDYAFVEQRVAVECEGGVWSRGRHTRGSGFVKDMEKYNHAAVMGWRLLRVTPDQLATTATVDMIRATLAVEIVSSMNMSIR